MFYESLKLQREVISLSVIIAGTFLICPNYYNMC